MYCLVRIRNRCPAGPSRNCIQLFSEMKGLPGTIWEQYVGHAPQDVKGKHHVARLSSVSRGEAEALDQPMDVFRRRVVEPLYEAIVKAHKPMQEPKILNILNRSRRRLWKRGLLANQQKPQVV